MIKPYVIHSGLYSIDGKVTMYHMFAADKIFNNIKTYVVPGLHYCSDINVGTNKDKKFVTLLCHSEVVDQTEELIVDLINDEVMLRDPINIRKWAVGNDKSILLKENFYLAETDFAFWVTNDGSFRKQFLNFLKS